MFPSRLVHHEVTTEAEVLLYHCVPKYNELLYINRVFAEKEFGWARFLVVCSYIKPIPTHEKLFVVGKSGPNATFNLSFLGLGWPWVGEFVGFIIIFAGFPTQQNLVCRKHPSSSRYGKGSRSSQAEQRCVLQYIPGTSVHCY